MNTTTRSIFISYARQDALEFAKRLATDLRNHSHRVFLDLTNIEKGGLWEVRLEEGIRSAAVLAAVITPYALREESVCRDEVVFALNEGKSIIPLRLDSSPNLQPTLLLARRNWIDFSADYREGLQSLLLYLSGDSSALRSPPLPTVTGLIPLDFGPEIARLTTDFTGRVWLNDELERWLNDRRGRAFVIVGEPGIGKSAIAAWLSIARREQTISVHFCTDRNSRTLEPFEFVASLVGQLCTQVSSFGDIVALRQPEVRRPYASDAFRELVVEPTQQLGAPASPLLVVVDSLDEAIRKDGETILDVIVNQAEDLPFWLRILATTRPDEKVLNRIRKLHTFELRADGTDNASDVTQYINKRSANLRAEERFSEESIGLVTARLPALANGNFLYARMTLDALEEGLLSAEDIGDLSPGISDFYAKTFAKLFPKEAAFEVDGQPILRALSVAMAPVPFAILDRVSRHPEESEEWTHRRLLRLKSYLRITGKGDEDSTYALFHKSLGDWLTDPSAAGSCWCSSKIGRVELADACWQDYKNDPERMTEYALRYAMFHLRSVGRDDDARTLSQDEICRRRRTQLGVGSFFMSYARGDDETFASKLHHDLTSRGFDIWFDREDLHDRTHGFLHKVREDLEQYDRLVLVAGPKVLASDYVRAEWQYALASGKDIIPVLRLSDFVDLPIELRQFHVLDFRDDARYETALIEFVRRIAEPMPPLGVLIGVPRLPPGFVAFPDRIRELKEIILPDWSEPMAMPDAVKIAGVIGLGGIGKTVLLSAFARDPQVRRAFPDGIFWLTLGQNPNLVRLQREFALQLGASGDFTNIEEGRATLNLLLAHSKALLILDDVWEVMDAYALTLVGQLCRTVLATRNYGVIRALGGTALRIDAMSEADAVTLLAYGAETSTEQLPSAALDVAKLCGGHPLALSLVSGMVRRGLPWTEVRDRIRQGDIKAYNRHDSITRSIELSYQALTKSEQERLGELAAAFEEGQSITESEIIKLWENSEGMSKFESRSMLSTLSAHALINLHGDAADRWLITLHPLVRQFLRTISSEPE